MLTKTRIELMKLSHKPRTYVGFIGMAAIIILMLIAVKYGDLFLPMRDYMSRDFILFGSFVNAVFLTRYLLEGIIYTFLPLFACLVCGDLIPSEAADGTLRTVLCRPISKLGWAISKYVVGAIYIFALTMFSGIMAYLIGWAFLGRGSLVVFDDRGIWIFSEGSAILRLLATYGLVAVATLAVGSLSFVISTFLSNANAAIISGMTMLYTSAILQEIEYFKFLKPY
ncbi:MAG: ABC transporter permease, partial [Armatimonadota bacterium]|nr:ABC transporter permease [Armatimonadota bacterium]